MPTMPPAFSSHADDRIGLPAAKSDGPRSLEHALAARRSVRRYSPEPLPLADMAQLMWAVQGVTSPDGLRTAPSAGALHPLELSLVAGAVEALPPGIYRYDPADHALSPVAPGDRRKQLSTAALWQECVLRAPAVMAISGVYERTTFKYGERGLRYVHMEVGHAAQNVCLQAVALGLSAVVVGAFRDSDAKHVLRLRANEEPLCLIPIGRKGCAR